MIIKKNEYEVIVGEYKARVVEGGVVVNYPNGLNDWDELSIRVYIEFLRDILLAKEMLKNENPVN